MVRVEFYGMARQRAGVTSLDVQAANLQEVFAALNRQLPHFADVCLHNGRLRPDYLANINGRQFTSDLNTSLEDGDAVLILSADAGG